MSTQVLGKLSSLSRLRNRPAFKQLPFASPTPRAHRRDSRSTFKLMRARRVLIETDEHGRPKDLPTLPPHAKVEAIFLVLEEGVKASGERRRPASLAGLKITGDIVSPAIEETAWSIGS
jgi:hypothetical protein